MVGKDNKTKPKADPQTQLLEALRGKKISNFCNLLKSETVDLDHCYGCPEFKTCLDIACSEAGFYEFVKLILDNRVDVNKINEIHCRAPIHFAAEIGDIRIIESLLRHKDIKVNDLSKGNTALHLAIKKIDNIKDNRDVEIKKFECVIERLVKAGTDVNISDMKNITPIHTATKLGLENIVKIIISNSKYSIDIDSCEDFDKSTTRMLLQEMFPHLLNTIAHIESESESIDITKLFKHLNNENEDKFIEDFVKINNTKKRLSILAGNNGSYTLLQYACKNGMDKAVNVLLQNGADPNLTFDGNKTTPIAFACKFGYFKVLEHLMNSETISLDPDREESLLQIFIKNNKYHKIDENVNYKECMKILMQNRKICLDINYKDFKGNTALHYAVRSGNQETVLSVLRKGACIGIRNCYHVSPITDISVKTLETFLDECLVTNDNLPNNEDYEIQFKYRFLVPPTDVNYDKSTKIPLMDDSDVKVNECNHFLAPETDALLEMTKHSELKPLLKHPIITSFLYLKWYRISPLFYMNIVFYGFFWISLTVHILYDFNADNEKTNSNIIAKVAEIFTIIGLILLVFRETVQLFIAPKIYLRNYENLLEICLIFITIELMSRNILSNNSRQQLYSVAILLSSAEFLLLFGQFPIFSTYIAILKTVTWNFFKFLMWYCILILAFALSFYTLFHITESKESKEGESKEKTEADSESDDVDFFLNPAITLFKTIVMLTGEFDVSSLDFKYFPVTSHIIFIIFVFMIPIVLFNLLNGLAVSDIQAIKSDAELIGYISLIELIVYFENLTFGDVSPWKNVLLNMPNPCFSFLGRIPVNSKSKLLKTFGRKICLFPCYLPDARIGVKINKESEIIIYPKDTSNKNQKACCFNACKLSSMDRNIVKAAKSIVIKRYEEKSELTQLQEKVESLEIILRQIYDSVKQY